MRKKYKKIGKYILVKEGKYFGISDHKGDILLPCEYDSVFYESGGFIITKKSKSGYIRFHEKVMSRDEYDVVSGYPEKSAELFLPCIYDRIEPTRNGLVLYSMTKNKYYGAKREWYDYKSGKIYKNLHFLRNYGEFDKFLDMDNPKENSKLKKCGEDRYISLPFNISGEILYEVSIYNGGARYFVCSEDLSDEEIELKGHICEYFFLIILPNTYTFTEPKPEIALIFEDFPRIVSIWDKEAKREKERNEYEKGKWIMAGTRQEIYDGKGMRIGWIEADERGNKRVCSCSKGVVGYYYKDTNRTVTVSGKIVAYADCSTALLFS